MTDDTPTTDTAGLGNDPEALVARYGADLDAGDLSEAQQAEIVSALWQIMIGFVDLGFSIKAGDKFTATSETGMGDVLGFLIPKNLRLKQWHPKNQTRSIRKTLP
ncbi:MAG: hypothetical protein AAF409_18205 [Pseudomonadota bacterium]